MKPRRIRVALLMGGPSAEHDISLESGRHVHKYLNKDRYEVLPVVISRKGDWPIKPEDLKEVADVAFLAMHGEYGEDGQVQEILRDLGIPHTHSSVMPSSLAINKHLAERIFRAHGMKTPSSLVFKRHEVSSAGLGGLDLPVVVKPADRGSAIGASLVRTEGDLRDALEKALSHSTTAVVQEYVDGREFACGVIDDGQGGAFPLPVVEIIPKMSSLYDYAARYVPGASELIIPARISDGETGQAQAMALRAHEGVGAAGVSRTDMILGPDGDFYVLEINTIPGLTEMSLLPRAAAVHGMGMTELVERLIDSAFLRHQSLGEI